MAEALSLLTAEGPPATLMAGGTDLLVRMKRNVVQPTRLIDITALPGLSAIRHDASGVTLGAAVTHTDAARSEIIRRRYSALSDACSQVAAWQVRNLGTVGGNVCNASPSAETAPPLLVLDATFALRGPGGERTVAAADFFLAPGKSVLAPDEILTEIRLPASENPTGSAYYKLSPRQAMDVAIVGAAAHLQIDGDTGRCLACRVALGAVAPTPIRAFGAEAHVTGRVFSPELAEEAGELAVEPACPIDDVRGSAGYRCRMVAVAVSRALAAAYERALGDLR
jgi:CO/xanthine dehydrogenase FAD-binding subunit